MTAKLRCTHCHALRPYTPGESVLYCAACGEWYHTWEFALVRGGDDDGRGYEVLVGMPGPEPVGV